jgi:predicted nucleic acid-binding protein
MKAVINTSPLIVLFKANLTDLLPQLFTEIVVPGAVWDEVVKAGKSDLPSQQLGQVEWAKRIEVTNLSPRITAWGLDPGESEVLSFALENPDYRGIVDDAAARKVARTLDIPIIGTIGLILFAKQRDVISSVSDAITAIQDAGLWLSDGLIQFAKNEAGED